MCGIGGVISRDTRKIQSGSLRSMASNMAHRGPDAETTWINDGNSAGFAHRRLSIIDISPEAGQPMHYGRRFTIVYNGEIYNYKEIRVQLLSKGVTLTTVSDTEVVVASYAAFGKDCLQLFDGMFAFAIWDDQEKELFCARDRFGEKPFFYLHESSSGTLYFASSLQALYAYGIAHEVNTDMLLAFVAFGNTQNPNDPSVTFDKNIRRLPAAHYFIYSATSHNLEIRRYWDIDRSAKSISMAAAAEKLRELLSISIQRRLRSDVRIGMSLSGGMDSSTIAALTATLGVKDFEAFTAVFAGFENNEEAIAREVASKFSLRQHFVEPTTDGLVNDLERLVTMQEEPFTSASVYAQYKVFEAAASQGVTVLLDGQGADEVLAGYDRYRNWKIRAVFPRVTASLLEQKQRQLLKHDPYLGADLVSGFDHNAWLNKPSINSLEDLLYYDIYNGGLEELLRYADRNSMAFGREVRLPFLNHELVDFVFGLPSSFKIGEGYTKLVLRKCMQTELPAKVTEKKRKIGFEPPQAGWMRNPGLIAIAEDSRRVLVSKGVLSEKVFTKKIEPHAAYAQNTREWRWLIAGQWMRLKKKGSE